MRARSRQNEKLIEGWKAEEEKPFTGWDFSYLDGRMLLEQPPWSYSTRARELMRSSASVLDIATGGGERLLSMRDSWPEIVVATEGYPPNLALARQRLEPLGVRVAELNNDEYSPMPFDDGEFSLVLNRHGALHVDEIARMLVPGGRLLTRQVHGLWAQDLLAAFGATPQWPDATPQRYVPLMRAAGLSVVDVQEWSGRLVFTDVGAIVYYLKAVPWLVPGFSVASHTANLMALQKQVQSGSELVYEARNYLMEAAKP
ncbi:MAG: methyltransferase domain-containing protein [Caldilineaceae bacterium SB0661_bin_32]|uniref:Methyltransferase domain-containing protein n=1 Tax=Caldilineaceae bacterium SB0661_bin_32 TaxID=2605255 RepID=A0A6B1DD34_9CHLR|nr:methyltransferase domain-containing protein [Caldilineaceae bacterium SB0661_bin_32]